MPVRAVDDKPSDTLVVVSGEGFWTGSSTLPHLHQLDPHDEALAPSGGGRGFVIPGGIPPTDEIGPTGVDFGCLLFDG
jgi:hypothetical protein